MKYESTIEFLDFLARSYGGKHPKVLKLVPEEIRNNPDVIMEIVKSNGKALRYASEEIKNNPEIVLEAVKNDGWALEDASEELKNNPEIVLEAVKNNGRILVILDEINEEIKTESLKSIVRDSGLHGLELDGYKLKDISDNIELMKELAKEDAISFMIQAPEKLKSNLELVRIAVKSNGSLLEFASEELRSNPEIVLEAVKNNGWALQYASEELRGNPEIVMEAVKNNRYNPNVLKYISDSLSDSALIDILATSLNFEKIENSRKMPDRIRVLLSKEEYVSQIIQKRLELDKVKQEITTLQQREARLSSLEAEEKTISEAEALIDRQTTKEGQDIGEE